MYTHTHTRTHARTHARTHLLFLLDVSFGEAQGGPQPIILLLQRRPPIASLQR